jgi:hypothetical protein
MVRRSFGEEMHSKKERQPLDEAKTTDDTRGSAGARSTIERMNKMEKILALVNSPHEGEALSAVRMVMKLSRDWGIDLGLLRSSFEEQGRALVDKIVQSSYGHSSASYAVPKEQVHERSVPENPRRTTPSFVKAHLRRRRGGPPFPVRPHRRRRRARRPSTTRGSWARAENLPHVFR